MDTYRATKQNRKFPHISPCPVPEFHGFQEIIDRPCNAMTRWRPAGAPAPAAPLPRVAAKFQGPKFQGLTLSTFDNPSSCTRPSIARHKNLHPSRPCFDEPMPAPSNVTLHPGATVRRGSAPAAITPNTKMSLQALRLGESFDTVRLRRLMYPLLTDRSNSMSACWPGI